MAIEKENIEIINLLLTKDNIDVNIPYILNQFYIKFKIISFNSIRNRIQEKTPLHLAVEKNYIKIIKILLAHKNIDVDIEDKQGKKPIDYTSNNDIIKLLKH